jgi:hypothetical protein
MFVFLFFLLMVLSCYRGLVHNTSMVALIITVGFLQDPVRKLLPGEPVVMTVMVGVVIACIMVRQLLVARHSLVEPFMRWDYRIVGPLMIYLGLVGLQALHSLARYSSPFITALGAIFYLAPLATIIVGYTQFQAMRYVRIFLFVFCALAFVVAVSVYLSFSGVESAVLNEVGSGLVIYDQGTVLRAYSGLMRSSEIASWHMGAAICFLLIMAVTNNRLSSWVLAGLVVAVLVGAIFLTGRRKMLVQIAIFSALFFPLLRYYQGRMSTRLVGVLVMLSVLGMAVYSLAPNLDGTTYDLYLARGASVFGDAGERFRTLGLGSISWAIRAHGLFGGGLGVASQGAAHFVQGISSGAGEGGLGKLVSELGVLALPVIAWLAYRIASFLHKCLMLAAKFSPDVLGFVVGIAVFLVANIPTFVVASQVYGDVFVLLVLGLLTGALFAIPKLVTQQLAERKMQPGNTQ